MTTPSFEKALEDLEKIVEKLEKGGLSLSESLSQFEKGVQLARFLREELEKAAAQGIKIFPIASSGLDDQGEYIFRQIAQFTQGRFVFLTYAGPTNGGAPGDETTHHVEDYSVENLDDLLVRLVEEELAYQDSGLAQVQ